MDQEPNWPALIRDCFAHPTDHDRLSRFFQQLYPYLWAALSTISSADKSMVEDALQSAFLKYMKIFSSPHKADLSVGYFVVVARNCLIDELRRHTGHVPLDEVAEADLPHEQRDDPEEQEMRRLLVLHGLSQLDQRCQFVLESYYIDEVDSQKLAKQLGVGPDSIHVVIKRRRDRLREVLTKTTETLRSSAH